LSGTSVYGILELPKPSNGKLVLQTGSIGIIQNYETEIIPQEYVEKIKSAVS
jgi:hypothetical protein